MQALPLVDNFLPQLMMDRNPVAPHWGAEEAEGEEGGADAGLAALALLWTAIFQEQILPPEDAAAASPEPGGEMAKEIPSEGPRFMFSEKKAVLPDRGILLPELPREKETPIAVMTVPAEPRVETVKAEQPVRDAKQADPVPAPTPTESLLPELSASPELTQVPRPEASEGKQQDLRKDFSAEPRVVQPAQGKEVYPLPIVPQRETRKNPVEGAAPETPAAEPSHETVVHFVNRAHTRILNRPAPPTSLAPPPPLNPPAIEKADKPDRSIEEEPTREMEVAQAVRGTEVETPEKSDAEASPKEIRSEPEAEMPERLQSAVAQASVRPDDPETTSSRIDPETPVATAPLGSKPDPTAAQPEPARAEKPKAAQWTPPELPAKPPEREARTISIRIPLAETGSQRQHIDLVFHQRNQALSLHLQSPTPHLQRQMEASMPTLLDKLRGEDWVPQQADSSAGAATPTEALLRSTRSDAVVSAPLAAEFRREQILTTSETQNSQDSQESPAGRKDAQDQNHQRRDRKKESVWDHEFEEQFGA